jgi:hypothetical protein
MVAIGYDVARWVDVWLRRGQCQLEILNKQKDVNYIRKKKEHTLGWPGCTQGSGCG